jgi:hypothetical protein
MKWRNMRQAVIGRPVVAARQQAVIGRPVVWQLDRTAGVLEYNREMLWNLETLCYRKTKLHGDFR